MRGKYMHNVLVADPLERFILKQGGFVSREYPVALEDSYGAIDLWVTFPSISIAIEIECSPKRVLKDIRKAVAAGADELWIVVPRAAQISAIRRKMTARGYKKQTRFHIYTLGTAKRRVSELFSSFSLAHTSIENRKTNIIFDKPNASSIL